MTEFDLNDIYRQAFGYQAPKGKFTIPPASDYPSEGQRIIDEAESAFKMETKTPRLERALLGGRYYDTDIFGREFFLPVQLDGYILPFAVVSILCKKTIVSTPMPERGGTVKELISIDDYQINVKGILINDDNIFPESEIIDLHELFLKAESVNMQCVLTDIFLKGAFNQRVVIKDLKFPAVIGIEHAKPFEMELESDMIFDLVKKNS